MKDIQCSAREAAVIHLIAEEELRDAVVRHDLQHSAETKIAKRLAQIRMEMADLLLREFRRRSSVIGGPHRFVKHRHAFRFAVKRWR